MNIGKEHRWHVYMSMRYDMYICLCAASHREKYVPAARHYGAPMPASYNILNMECSMPYRADLSQPYPSPTASKIFSPNPNESMSQLFILLTHLHTFLKNSLPLLNSSINR